MLDESTQRLRPEVEAELLRIAQEAMNNAVRHSEATLIEVQCTVAPPLAEITIADDGRGIVGRRETPTGSRSSPSGPGWSRPGSPSGDASRGGQ